MIDVREEIANAPIGAYHRFLALLIGLVVFFDGYDTFNPAYVIHYVMKPWHLSAGRAGWLVSSGLVGFMIGSLCRVNFPIAMAAVKRFSWRCGSSRFSALQPRLSGVPSLASAACDFSPVWAWVRYYRWA